MEIFGKDRHASTCYQAVYSCFILEFTQSFGLLIRWPEDSQDKLLMFRLPGEDINRKELTEQIARLMADSKSSANTVSENTGWDYNT